MDDPRNTDNAWFETTALNFHDTNGNILRDVNWVPANGEIKAVKWVEVSSSMVLFARHKNLARLVAKERGAHW